MQPLPHRLQPALRQPGADPRRGAPEKPLEADSKQHETDDEQNDVDQTPVPPLPQENGARLPELTRQIWKGCGKRFKMLSDQHQARCRIGEYRILRVRRHEGRSFRLLVSRPLPFYPIMDGRIFEEADKLMDLPRHSALDTVRRYKLLRGNRTAYSSWKSGGP